MRNLCISTLAGISLLACQTTPTPLSADELEANANILKTDITAGQEPVEQAISLYEAMARALKYNLDHRVTRSLLSGRESLEPSTSTDRDFFSGDLTATWNVLDFGLSKIRSEQLGDEVLIYEERKRKAIIQIMEDVHSTYWRAVSADRLGQRLEQLETDVRMAFEGSRQLYVARRTAPMPALSYQRELNDIQSQAQRMKRELSLAKMELGALMGLASDKEYRLQTPDRLPRPLFNNDWVSYGARASWNLIKVFETPVRKRKAHARLALERQKALAAAMAVMTQVSVSRARYHFLTQEYDTATQGTQVQSDILNQVEALSRASSASRQSLVREQMNALLAESRRDSLHAEMQEAMANVYTAMGYDPYGIDINGGEDVATIAESLETLWAARQHTPSL